MGFISVLISTVIVGLVVGALGRLALPGPNPMTIGMTILVGIGGAFVGGLVASLLGAEAGITLILQVAAAAGIVYLMERRRRA
ncbi:MAG: GlsB/YeaQ/YmgE family stress response membrane protein [Actinomycetota bacterium]